MPHKRKLCEPVLLVEPTIYYVNLLRDWLTDLGFLDIHTCTTAHAARTLLDEQRFGAIVIDSKLEDGSGITLARDVRHSTRSVNRMTPIVILDGRATRRRVSAARDGGASEYVCKPMSRRSFTEHLRIALSDQRSFIKAHGFFGPDRRRRPSGWEGDDRRRIKPRRVPKHDTSTDVTGKN